MTDRQVAQLRLITDPGNPGLMTSEQEAIGAALVERAAYAKWAESFLALYFGMEWNVRMLTEAAEQLRVIHAKATGGTP